MDVFGISYAEAVDARYGQNLNFAWEKIERREQE